MHFLNLFVSVLPFLALSSASPLAHRDEPPKPFGIIAAHSASPIHLQAVNAAGQAFWIGRQPTTYCPTNVPDCPPGNLTVFAGLNALDTEVPGGQILYVCPSLALGFTMAHSILVPEGCTSAGFSWVPPVEGGNGLGTYSFTGFGANGFMACPTTDGYQVYAAGQNATTPLGDVNDCIGFDALTAEYDGAGPNTWQYI